jgi:hypothetical protein
MATTTKSSVALSRKPLSEGPNTAKEKPTDKAIINNKDINFETLYLNKDFKGAAQFLLDNKQQLDSGIFHYNLGTIYSKMGDHATARYHLEKSIKEGYINSSSLNNLAYIKSQLKVDDLTTSTSLPDEIINFTISIPKAGYFSITLCLIMLILIAIKANKIKKKILICILVFFAVLPIIFSTLYLKNINYAVALKDLPLYEGPSKIFIEKGKIQAGSKIILGEYKDGWFKVEFPITLSGWINKDQLGLY